MTVINVSHSQKKIPKKLIVAGGGTGGHVLAGIAIADEWIREQGHANSDSVLFVGSENGIEVRLVPKQGYRLELLRVGALNRVGLRTKIETLFRLPLSFLKAARIILSFRPDAIIGVGGYASGPIVLLGRVFSLFLNCRTAILEQNSVAGFTNRLLGRWVHRVFTAFPDQYGSFVAAKVKITGNPIRSNLKRLPASDGTKPFTLFIFGGSQGAVGMNSMVIDALPYLNQQLKDNAIQIIHQTGIKDFERVTAAYQREGTPARIEKFIDDMPSCYAAASLIICRAGASSMAEIASVGRCAIFVPLPTAADNHQEKNARIFEQSQAAIVVPQGSMSGKEFAELILSLKANPDRILQIEKNVQPFYVSDSASQIVKDLCRP
jgi:UDP-N-acetylglucosamine--N-acetylmuramyl-(pentapeptide) pyrophosphoryl-undecaprenol N-acetylglucosamine transferase